MEPIAVIGIGCRFPGATGPEAFWRLLQQGGDAITEVPADRWDLEVFYDPDPAVPGKMITRWGGFLDRIDQFDAAFFRISPREAAQIDPQQRLLLEVAWEALEDAGQVVERLAGSQTGVFIGIMNPEYGLITHRDLRLIDAYSGPGNGFSIVANRLSYAFDFMGPSLAIDTACSSSLIAIHLACVSLRRGECKLALAGGVNALLSPWGSIYFSKAGLMAPDGRCKAFDARANGIVRSEGSGIVILKLLADALADGDPIYAVIRGSAANHDGRTNGITAPNRWAQEAVLRRAYQQAEVSPGLVQYVETHGTGTSLGDPIEARALGAVLAVDRPLDSYCAIGSVKSNIGHLESAAGVAGLIKVALSLKHKQIPPSLHFQEPNRSIPFDKLPLRVQQTLSPWPEVAGRALAGVSAFGFGGANAHVVLEEAPPLPQAQAYDARPAAGWAHLLTLSARSREALRDLAGAYCRFLADESAADSLFDLCYTAGARRSHHEHRLALVGHSAAEFIEHLEAFLKDEARPGMSSGHHMPGRWRKIVFVFPGQGSQWVGMGRQLLAQEPVFRETLERCEEAIRPHVDWSLLEGLTAEAYPRLDDIDVIQPTLFAIEVSLAALWRSWGIEPDAVVGHSMGEVAAAHVAGILSLEDAARIICRRSQLLRRKRGQGAMVVVELSLEQARQALAGYEDRVSIAVSNSPTSTVLSGDPAALQEIVERLHAQDVFCRWVKVDVASHSPQMDSLRADLLQVLEGLSPRPASVPIYSTVIGQISDGLEFEAAYWVRNLREPVLFSTAVQQLVEDGHDTFIEISPHPILLGALQRGFYDLGQEGALLASLRREEEERAVMLGALGALYALGQSVDWSKLYPTRGQCVRLPSYPWQHERCWLESQDASADQSWWHPGQGRGSPNGHPLLGWHSKLAHLAGTHLWESELDRQLLPYLDDHRIQGALMLPGMSYVEMALAAAAEAFGDGSHVLTAMEFQPALLLPEKGAQRIQVSLCPGGSGETSFHVYSCPGEAAPPDEQWTLRAAGKIRRAPISLANDPEQPIAPQEFRAGCADEVAGGDYYLALRARGVQYGPAFQGLERIWRRDGEVLGQVRVPGDSAPRIKAYQFHPATLEACVQALVAAAPVAAADSDRSGVGVYLPVSIDRVQVYRRPGDRLWSHVRVRPQQGQNGHVLEGEVRLLDEAGGLVAEFLGLRLQYQELDLLPQADKPAEKEGMTAGDLLAAEAEERQQLLEDYLRQRLAKVLQSAVSRLTVEQAINSLGLDSLMAIELKTGLERDFGVVVPLIKFFQNLSITQVATFVLEQLATLAAVPTSPLAPAREIEQYTIVPSPERRYQPFSLTDVQQAYWIGRNKSLELGNIACHIYEEIEFDELDVERFNLAWQQLIQRHDMLRAIVLPDGRQQVLEQVPPYQIQVLDLRGQDSRSAAAQLEAVRDQMSHQMLPTDQWPLFEVRASRLDDGRVRLHFSIDALIADAWSLALLDRELTQLYRDPQATLAPLALSFQDYVTGAALEDSEMYRRSWEYWRNRLPTLPPGPELPLAKSPAAVSKPLFVRRSASLEPDAWLRLKERATQAGVTPSGILLAAFAEILTAWSKNPHFTINLTLFNRFPLHPQVNDIIGDFTSLTLLEVNNAKPGAFQARARRLQEQLWEDLEHRYVSGVRVQRELARMQGGAAGATMPVVFTSTLIQDAWGGEASLLLGTGALVYGVSQTPQIWLDHQIFEKDGALFLNWDAVEELFPAGLLDDMLAAYHRFLQRLADEEQIWQETTQCLAPPAQLEQRAAVNATGAPVPPGLLHEPFLAQATQRPHRPAVISLRRTLTYDELYRRSNQVGRRLRELGARPNRLVGIVMDKGWEQVVAVLGVLAAGAAYLPIDPALPTERVWYLLEHGQVELALTQPWLDENLEWPAGVERLSIEEAAWEGVDEGPLAAVQGPEDLAYVIFTSGSTGLPKGVMIDHRGALNTCVDVNRRFNVGPEDRVLALSSLNFDLSVYDIFGLLAVGGAVVLPEAAARRDPAHWAELLERERVTLWDTVPALMEMLVEYVAGRGGQLPAWLRLILMSGDWIPVTLPDRIRALATGPVEVISQGGATEASIWSILYPIGEVDPAWKSIPYGRPMVNQSFEVLNEWLEPRPVWVPGQLYIGGIGLAQGYWRDADKTAASFIEHPKTGERLYRTGDLGRYLPDGNIEFLGREDFQVKIRGYRIELGEIEVALEQHPGVRAGVVLAVGEPRGDKRLVAYVVSAGEDCPTTVELRNYLKEKLPEYMIPATFMFLDTLPLTANGKVDRKALPSPDAAPPVSRPVSSRTVTTAIATKIAQLVSGVLNRDIGLDANLLELGANSVDLIRIAGQLENEFGFRPEMIEFFRMQTLDEIADYYELHLVQSRAPVEARSADDAILASFQVLLDPDERDAFKKRQPGLREINGQASRIKLPAPALDEALVKQYTGRCSHRRFVHQPIPLEQFGKLLSCLRQIPLDGGPKYLYGSAGPTYSVQTYLYAKPERVEGVSAGVYYYHPVANELVLLSTTDRINRTIHFFENQTIFDESAFSVFFISQLGAIAPLYGEKSRDFAMIEAGLMAQLLETQAPACQIGLCQIGNMLFEEIKDLFALDESHIHLHTLLGGRIGWEEGEL